jgi:hypothetical protein
VGHWLGLYHTNQNRLDDACDPKDVVCALYCNSTLIFLNFSDYFTPLLISLQNDMVEDTPQQYGKPPRGCPPNTTDSCPDLPGFDPIHNYMSVSPYVIQNAALISYAVTDHHLYPALQRCLLY